MTDSSQNTSRKLSIGCTTTIFVVVRTAAACLRKRRLTPPPWQIFHRQLAVFTQHNSKLICNRPNAKMSPWRNASQKDQRCYRTAATSSTFARSPTTRPRSNVLSFRAAMRAPRHPLFITTPRSTRRCRLSCAMPIGTKCRPPRLRASLSFSRTIKAGPVSSIKTLPSPPTCMP